MHAIWDPGWLIWTIILIVLAGIAWLCTLGGVVAAFLTKGETGPPFALLCFATALIIGALGFFVDFPFSGQYHRFVPKTGVVTAVGSRFLASGTQGGGSTQKFVVTMGGRDYGCNDTRCATVRKGDRLTLMCERSWQWAGVPGWDCNWGIDHQANGNVIP